MPKIPWYLEGLRFQCLGCGRCCTGDPGYVWVENEEIAALAEALAMDCTEFEGAFVRSVGERRSLIEMPNGDCAFFDGHTRRCRVYEARPLQCRTWPFWQSNVQSSRAWQEACRMCPGSGQGAVVPWEMIKELVAVVPV
jgi:Fe-S-cluster containining protein